VSRGHHRILSAIGIGCYVLAAIAALFLLTDDFGPGLLIPLWIAHGVLLAVLLAKVWAGGEAGAGLALLVVGASLAAVSFADTARDDLTLERRGEKITATVVREWLAPSDEQGRQVNTYDYALVRRDGTAVPGPALHAGHGSYTVGQTLTVIADPEGVLRPETPSDADATGDAVGVAVFALIALALVAFTAGQGAGGARRAERDTLVEQEHTLREALRTAAADPHGYVEVHAEHYPDVSPHRAARIARELGLNPENADDPGSWRFLRT